MSIVAILIAWLFSAGNTAQDIASGGIPFAFEDNQIVLPVSVDGHDSLRFLLDTGGEISTIDFATAQRLDLGVRAIDSEQGGTPAITWLTNLKLGNLVQDSLYAVAVDLSRISRQMHRPLNGVLGHNFLAGRIVQIDYPRHVVRFLEGPPVIEKSGKNVMLPMVFLTGRHIPMFEKMYVREKPIRATLDTGSSMGLLLYQRTVAELGMQEEYQRAPRASVLLYHGDVDVRKGQRVQVKLQAASFDSVQVYFAATNAENHLLPDRDGNLGNDFFKNTRLTLDYKNERIAIER